MAKAKKDKTKLTVDEKIDLLENQIHTINIKLNKPEQTSWWKKHSSLVISIVALATSISFSVYGIIKEANKDSALEKSSKVKKIEELTFQLTEVEAKSSQVQTDPSSQNANLLLIFYNYQRLIYLKEVLKLIREVDVDFPPDIYSILGTELKMEGRSEEALELFKIEAQNSTTPVEKTVAFRDIGSVFSIPNTSLYNIDSTRYYYNKSVEVSDDIAGEKKYEYKGYSYQMWASVEFYLNNRDSALNLINKARSEYLKLNDNYGSKYTYIQMINQMVDFENNKTISQSFYHLVGQWKIYSDNLEGHMYFMQNGNNWSCSIELFEDNELNIRAAGPLISFNNSHIAFALDGAQKKITPYGDISNFMGSVKLYPDKINELTIYGRLLELDEREKKFTLVKVK